MGKESELVEAARQGNYPLCEKLLSLKPKKPGHFASLRRGNTGCNARDVSGYTALHHAALNNHKDIVELLLAYEASCNSTDNKGSSSLHLASWAGHSEIVKILLTSGPSIANANLTNSDKETALHSASQYGHIETVKLLLEHGADPNIKNSKNETALDLAALYGRTNTVQLLLKVHPELVGLYTAYRGTLYAGTPLHLASRNGHREVVEIILKAGIDINVRTNRGTALHEAALCGKINVITLLLKYNIHTELLDSSGRTVIQVMEDLPTSRSRDIVKIIFKHKSLLNSSDIPLLLSPYEHNSLAQSLDSIHYRSLSASKLSQEIDHRNSTFSSHSTCSTDISASASKSIDSHPNLPMDPMDDDNLSLSSISSCQRSNQNVETKGDKENKLDPIIESLGKNKSLLPIKPIKLRQGLKLVKIPKIEEKTKIFIYRNKEVPLKPPRRNLSISPIRNTENTSTMIRKDKNSNDINSSFVNSSKSYDGFNGILCDNESTKKHQQQLPLDTRHSCDELLTRLFYEEENSDNSSISIVSDSQNDDVSKSELEEVISSRTEERTISQRQYKRKLKRDSPNYVPLERRKSSGENIKRNELSQIKMVTKTTIKWLSEEDSPEIQNEPPSPTFAENEIAKFFEKLSSSENKRSRKSVGTEIETSYLVSSNEFSSWTPYDNVVKRQCNEINNTKDLVTFDTYETQDKEWFSRSHRHSLGSDPSSQSTPALSPFDEKNEWMQNFYNFEYFGNEFGRRKNRETKSRQNSPNQSNQFLTWKRNEKVHCSVKEWLEIFSCSSYSTNFLDNGFDHIEFLGQNLMSVQNLIEIGVFDDKDRSLIYHHLTHLPLSKDLFTTTPQNIKEWLKALCLEDYTEFCLNDAQLLEKIKNGDLDLIEMKDFPFVKKKGHLLRIQVNLLGLKSIMREEIKDENEFSSSSSSAFTFLESKGKKFGNDKQEKIKSNCFSFPVKYFGKKAVKDCKGQHPATSEAIESMRKAKAGRLRYLLINEKSLSIIKRDTKEVMEIHELCTISSVVHDKSDPRILGYMCNGKTTHVFSTDSQSTTSKIVDVIRKSCNDVKTQNDENDIKDVSLKDTSTASVHFSRSDALVSKMKLFFQGSSYSDYNVMIRNDSPRQQNILRKRGGSIDDLIDKLDEPITELKKKSTSTRNLAITSLDLSDSFNNKITTV